MHQYCMRSDLSVELKTVLADKRVLGRLDFLFFEMWLYTEAATGGVL